jgi:hypothetical protein
LVLSSASKTLWSRAHDQCAFYGCLQDLTVDYVDVDSGNDAVKVLGEEAHIRARSVGGPRFDPTYKDVNGYKNLILLCPNHHSMIDAGGGGGYTVEYLLEMKASHEKNQQKRNAIEAPLRAYLGDRYTAENSVQFHQVDLRGPSVDAMFVDVPIGCRRDGTQVAGLLQRIASSAPGDTGSLERSTGLVITGATQALLHPEWSGNAVLVGGPGQGKSTLLQYVCQFHRARRLGRSEYAADSITTTETVRFPIRIDLRKYAQWAVEPAPLFSGKKGKSKKTATPESWRSIESFLVKEISDHIGAHNFSVHDLVLLLATEPVLLALDGLDEVASMAARTQVIDEIVQMHGRIGVDAADLVVLLATRPGSSLQPLTASGMFPVLHLQRLTSGLRLQYLTRWCQVTNLSPEATAKLQATFMDSQHVPHINELAAYPMQLAILLHLLYRRQFLPQQRTELYAEYLKTFLDREQTQDKEPLLRQKRRVLEETHAYLGWYLQAKAEEGRSAGSITRTELRKLLREYLVGREEEQTLADEIYSAITDRVLCLVERDDAFEFEVQSLREYFAAVHIFENLTPKGTGNSRDDGLNALLTRPYWANVCRFFMGRLARGEVRGLMGNFESVNKKVAPLPLIRAMAATVLNDRIYDDLLDREVREVVDFILNGPGVVFAHDGILDSSGSPMVLGNQAGRSQAVAHLKSRLKVETNPRIRAIVASRLAAHAVPHDRLKEWWWENYEKNLSWLFTAAHLQTLQTLPPDQTRQLEAVLGFEDDPETWRLDVLVDGKYDGSDNAIVGIAVDSLNSGAAETVRLQTPATDVEVTAAMAADLLEGPYKAGTSNPYTAPQPSRSETTERIQRHTSGLHRPPSDSIRPDDWASYLSNVADAWGDGWVLRRVVSMTPTHLELSRISPRVQNGDLIRAVKAESNYRENRANGQWWEQHFASTSDPTELMLATIAVLELARPQVILEIAGVLNAVVGKFTGKRFRTLERALKRDSTAYRVRVLDLQEALRLQRVDLSGRLLWLVWILSNDSTRDRIRTHLEPKLHDVFSAGTSEGIVVISAAQPTRKLRLETFKDTRHALRGNGWLDPTQFTTVTLGLAKSILEAPSDWPADLVQMAADRLGAKAGAQTPSLAEVAASADWFRS